MAKVWLITGSGNGLGRDIAEAALAAGDSVVAGARRTEELAPLVAQYGGRAKPVRLEVRDESAAKAAAIVDTCFYGVVYTTRAAVPVMRKQRSGHIFQYAVSRGQVGGGRFQRLAGDRSRAVRGQDLHTGAGRYPHQLGPARRSECA